MINFQKKIIKRKKNKFLFVLSIRNLYNFHSINVFYIRMKVKLIIILILELF